MDKKVIRDDPSSVTLPLEHQDNPKPRPHPTRLERQKHSFNAHRPFMINQHIDVDHVNSRQHNKMLCTLIKEIKHGSLKKVKELLEGDPKLRVTEESSEGMTAMKCAILYDRHKIMTLFLDMEKVDLAAYLEAMTMAFEQGNDKTSLAILRHPLFSQSEVKNLIINFGAEDSRSPPFVVAAKYGQTRIIKHFLDANIRLPEHNDNCPCELCHNRILDELLAAQRRLDSYKALSNEVYISLSAKDPLQRAFKLRRELLYNMEKEKHFKPDYEILAGRLEKYSYDILEYVDSEAELDTILRYVEDSDEEEQTDEQGAPRRLQLAIEYEEEMFVNHPETQRKISLLWNGSYNQFEKLLPKRLQPFSFIVVCLVIPLCCVIDMIYGVDQVKKILRTPYVIYTGKGISSLVFLLLIACFSVTQVANSGSWSDYADKEIYINSSKIIDPIAMSSISVRQIKGGNLEGLLTIFIFGFVIQESKNVYYFGIKGHFNSIYKKIDFVALALYLCWCFGRVIAFQKTEAAINYFREVNISFICLEQGTTESYHLYWLVADRSFWQFYDLVFVSDGLFAIANVMTFNRLLYMLLINETLGPLYITLSRIIKDISRFLVFFLIIFPAFFIALSGLLRNQGHQMDSTSASYAEQQQLLFQDTAKHHRNHNIAKQLFFALFEEGDIDFFFESSSPERQFGLIMYSAYYVAVFSVLVPMLVAMMNTSFLKVQNRDIVEWKFARAALYMDYIEVSSIKPIPFNIMPSPRRIFQFAKSAVQSLVARYRKRNRKEDPEQILNHIKMGLGQRTHQIPLATTGIHVAAIGVPSCANEMRNLNINDQPTMMLHDVVTRYLAHHKNNGLTSVENKISQVMDEFTAIKIHLKKNLGQESEETRSKMRQFEKQLYSVLEKQHGTEKLGSLQHK